MIEKKCPICFSSVANESLRCPHCGWDFPPAAGEMLEAAKWLSDRIAEAKRQWRVKKPGARNMGGLADRPGLLRMTCGVAGQSPPPGPTPPAADLRLVKGGPYLPVNSLGMEFVAIEPGAFLMGAPEGEAQARDYERPPHLVAITRSFGMGRCPVTQEQWERVMGYNPSRFRGPDRPVESLSWEEAGRFVRKLNLSEKGDHHRLPTEAEWEYCARAGGDHEPEPLESSAWFADNSQSETRPVGQGLPNAWGLHDMLGQVWEWVFDWYGDYPDYPLADPAGPAEGSDKVIRGGAWGSSKNQCRVFTRGVKSPGERSPLIGLRLVREENLAAKGRFSVFRGWGP
jgi:formylglycine-generating enzyme required for sulfatase activity